MKCNIIIWSLDSLHCNWSFKEFKRDGEADCIVTGLINALLINSSLNTVQQATTEEAVFSVDPTDAPIDWFEAIT
jgi:hypothetical protein